MANSLNTMEAFTKRVMYIAVLTIVLVLLKACTSSGSAGSTLYAGDQWVVLPVTNTSGIASAASVSQSMVEANLRARSVNVVKSYANRHSHSGVDSNALEDIMNDARDSGARYGITGEVQQWGRAELNGRDSRVDIALSVYDLKENRVVWNSAHEAAARASSNTAKVANRTVMKLVNQMDLISGLDPNSGGNNNQISLGAANSILADNAGNTVTASPTGFRKVALDENGLPDAINAQVVGKSIALFYGANPPVEELSQFDRLVLEPDNISPEQHSALKASGATTYAYLSVGEIGPTRSYGSSVQNAWILGKNDVWNSTVLDMTNLGWTQFLMERINTLVQAGYNGLFLDTMDSYQIYAKSPEQRQAQEAALGQFIQQVSQRFEGIKLISNRGFEVLDRTGPFLEAVAAESLFASWDNTAQRYVDVPENDRQWLLGKLNAAKSQFGLDVIAIEYMPPERREEARKVATSVAQLGFTPWVSTPALDYVGVGSMEVMPRKVMMLFDSRINGKQASSEVSELVAPIIEYFGYVPIYVDVATEALPAGELVGQYAGVVTWSSSHFDVSGLSNWIKAQMKSGLPIAMFGHPVVPLDRSLAKTMGISLNSSFDIDSIKPTYKSDWIGFEKDLPVRISSIVATVSNLDSNNVSHLRLEDKRGTETDLVITGDWGGFAGYPAAANLDIEQTFFWVTDPFEFLKASLKLQHLPMPDVTSENGKRLWFSHIDGDALPSWAELPGGKLGAEQIHERILVPYDMPHSISIVEGEMIGVQEYADRRERMFDVAKRIFAMPSVELATHTFSHPYKWGKVEAAPTSGTFNLDVGNYQYSPEREIAGSARFIDEQLAPPGKKTELMLWSGDAIPEESALAATYNAGLINLNGGFTTMSKSAPTVTRISPMARTVGPYVQAYAPIMNENVYTNDWTGPFDGFRRVIETFEMTDKPRRFKPLSIYYHFYAGTKLAALRSLKEIYDWSTAQDINPIHASAYAKKVPDFRTAGVARYLDGNWKVSSLGNIKSIRILDRSAWPQMADARGIVGSRPLHDGMYVHTDGSNSVTFKLGKSESSDIHIVSANGSVENWQPSNNGIALRVTGHVPVQLELSRSASTCYIQGNGQNVRGTRTAKDTMLFTFTNRDTGNVTLNCQA